MDPITAVSLVISFLPFLIQTALDNSPKYQAHLEKIRQKALKMAEEANNYKSEIPNEYLQDANESILFPAIQTSIPYLNEKDIRKMFAKLIASAYDCRKNEYLHPGFINLITQLSPNDARILSFINNHPDFIGLICIKGNKEYPLIDSFDILSDIGIEQVALSIVNLKRLGILTIDSRLLIEKYPFFDRPIDKSLNDVDVRITNLITTKNFEIHSNDTFLTELGRAFLKVCIE